ncbi:50S ribosomal protein L1 [Candidatus Dependentiae bacterium]|nr:50S ribosomal protein L1 [Candidatus Dependentiae bacterium]MBU4387328.1 50S ribosomal protein L1 [Candidatus Dependentiae bacterium]MCG2756207.1 50S ribosomal protein L1 [Candidatus Dependentiae bacterium]
MIKTGKRIKKAQEALVSANIDTLKKGLEFVVKNASAKFDESVNLSTVLGIDASKGEQTVRGSALLPHGTGKSLRVLVFATGEKEQEAKAAGADFVGLEDLIEKIEGGWIGFDVAVATTDLMGKIGKLAKILGPKGLLPNKKVGTVTDDVTAIITDLKKGRVSFRNDKNGAVHAAFGKVSFGANKLEENLIALIKSIRAAKPASSKGKFIKKIVISSTMGVGVVVNPDEVV